MTPTDEEITDAIEQCDLLVFRLIDIANAHGLDAADWINPDLLEEMDAEPPTVGFDS